MASSPDAQQPDTLAPASSELPQQLRPRRVVLLDEAFTTIRYDEKNRQYLWRNFPMGDDLKQLILPSFSSLDLDLSRDVFYFSKEFIKRRFWVVDDELPRRLRADNLDLWRLASATRPSHIMLDARDMTEVLQEAIGGDSAFHRWRQHPDDLPRGILDFFQFFGISNPAVSNTLKDITVFIASRADDMLVSFEYGSLERVPYSSNKMLGKHLAMILASTETQKEQLNEFMGLWQRLEDQACNLRLPMIEFARISPI
ncbi:hypothetical protein VPNG_06996 [Cytospora leucostoma]|uniref:Uncharacterized protein n=1 Tax=Cytospora leucostoma TaxID=1230097 RepID=A0A423WNQ1_9PEZI|nr:hypothetical protein VPNG_06996 [Cytospora leucostoma]